MLVTKKHERNTKSRRDDTINCSYLPEFLAPKPTVEHFAHGCFSQN